METAAARFMAVGAIRLIVARKVIFLVNEMYKNKNKKEEEKEEMKNIK